MEGKLALEQYEDMIRFNIKGYHVDRKISYMQTFRDTFEEINHTMKICSVGSQNINSKSEKKNYVFRRQKIDYIYQMLLFTDNYYNVMNLITKGPHRIIEQSEAGQQWDHTQLIFF